MLKMMINENEVVEIKGEEVIDDTRKCIQQYP